LFPELDRDDVLQVHGRLITAADVDFRSGEFRIKLSRCDASGSPCTDTSVVFDQTVSGQDFEGTATRWRYRNVPAKTAGGIYSVKITSKTAKKVCASGPNDGVRCTASNDCPEGACVGYYAFKLKAYGDAAGAVSDMETQIFAGGHGWAVRGLWLQQPKGWRLYKKSQLLQPWF
jgi:hypothetical protein